MATAILSSHSLSRIFSFLPPPTTTTPTTGTTTNSKTHKTQLHFPYSLSSPRPPPSISLQPPRTPRNGGGLLITSSGGVNAEVVVDENESDEALLMRFRREVAKANVFREIMRRRYFENPQEKRKRKSREAAQRNRRRRPYAARVPKPEDEPTNNEPSMEESDDLDNDNWELPEGGLSF